MIGITLVRQKKHSHSSINSSVVVVVVVAVVVVLLIIFSNVLTCLSNGFPLVLKDGVRYTLSLYACTSDAPELLQKWEGYGQELGKESFQNYTTLMTGITIKLITNR